MGVTISFSHKLKEILSKSPLTLEDINSSNGFDKNFLRFLQEDKLAQLSQFNRSQYSYHLHFDNSEIFTNQAQYSYGYYKKADIGFEQLLARREIFIYHGAGYTTNYDPLTPWMLFHRSHHFLTIFDNYKFDHYTNKIHSYNVLDFLFNMFVLLNVKSCRAPLDYIPFGNDIRADIFSAVISNTLKFKSQNQIAELVDFLKNTPEFVGQFNPLSKTPVKTHTVKNPCYKSHSLDYLIDFPEEIKNLAIEILKKEVEFLLDLSFIIRLSSILGLTYNSMSIIERSLYLGAFWQFEKSRNLNLVDDMNHTYIPPNMLDRQRNLYYNTDCDSYTDSILREITLNKEFNTLNVDKDNLNLFLGEICRLVGKMYNCQQTITLFLDKLQHYKKSIVSTSS